MFAGAYLVVSGLGLLFAKGSILMPALRVLRQLTDQQMELMLGLTSKALIALGLTLFLCRRWSHRHRTSVAKREAMPP